MGKTTQRSSPTPRHRPHTPFTWPGQQACEGPSEVSVTRLVAVTGRMEDPGPRPSPRALSTESLFKSQDRETGSNPNPNPILLLLNHLLHSGHDPWGEKSASPLTLSSFHPLPLCQPLWEERLWHFQGPYPRHPIQPHYPNASGQNLILHSGPGPSCSAQNEVSLAASQLLCCRQLSHSSLPQFHKVLICSVSPKCSRPNNP